MERREALIEGGYYIAYSLRAQEGETASGEQSIRRDTGLIAHKKRKYLPRLSSLEKERKKYKEQESSRGERKEGAKWKGGKEKEWRGRQEYEG